MISEWFKIGPWLAATADSGTTQGSASRLMVFILITLMTSFLCSLLEATLLSTSLSHTQLLSERGSRAGRLMQKHKENVDQSISAVLTLNTIANTAGATIVGAEASLVFGSAWLGLFSAALTMMILIFSEIIPKTIGAMYWKQLTPFAAYILQGYLFVLFPAVWALEKLTNLITPAQKTPTVTRSELEILAYLSMKEGALNKEESRVFRNLLTLNKVAIGEIMTPRTVLFALQEDMTVGEVMKTHKILSFSRIPIYEENADDIAEFVLRHDILTAAAKDEDHIPIKQFARPLQSVHETLSVADAMEQFMQRHEHIFLVFDEYGGTAGIVTLEDAIEALIGLEITDESDVVADMRELAHQRSQRYQQLLNLSKTQEKKSTPTESS